MAVQQPEPLPPPTPRQLVIRSIGTALVIAALVAGVMVFLDARNEPASLVEFVQEPRTVSYGRLSLQIPSDWTLADLDECGHVQGDTLILGLAGAVRCNEGERDPEASDVVVSSLTGAVVAPAPDVNLRPVTLPSGLRGRRGTTTVLDPATDDEGNDEQPPLRATVLQIPSLDAQVVATSPNRKLATRILESAKRVPADSSATSTVAYLRAAIDVPPSWQLNAVRCGVPTADTVIAGHPGKPRLTAVPGGPCPRNRPEGITDITLDSRESEFSRRWGAIAAEPVTLLGGVKGVRGTKELDGGLTVTVVVVPELDAIAVARSADQALVNTVLSSLHRAVPVPPDEEQPTTTPSPQPTSRPTLPAGVKTRTFRAQGLALAVPSGWAEDALRCGVPQRDTVVVGAPPTPVSGCVESRPPGVSDLVIERLYGDYGSLWQSSATEPITLPSELSGLHGTTTNAAGLPVTVLAFPSLNAIIVATAADTEAQDLIDGILTTTRAAT